MKEAAIHVADCNCLDASLVGGPVTTDPRCTVLVGVHAPFEAPKSAVDDLIAFLRARLDEDEQAARTAAGNRAAWAIDVSPSGSWYVSPGRDSDDIGDVQQQEHAMHIARWDPARVLAEVEARRRMVDELAALDGDPVNGLAITRMMHLLALPYAEHPDYRKEWRP
jgi:hypothetical protein